MKFYQSIRFKIVAGITFFVMGNNLSKMIANLINTEVDTFLYTYKKDRTIYRPGFLRNTPTMNSACSPELSRPL